MYLRVNVSDSAGIVIDGYLSMLNDVDYTDEITAVSAQFTGFESKLCGGISSYEWAIGEGYEGLERESLMAFTTRGIVDRENGTGYAQVNLPGLQSFGNRRLFVTVRGITGCGDILESTSNGFIIDSIPAYLNITTGLQGIERSQGSNVSARRQYQVEAGYSSIWRTDDEESGLSSDFIVYTGTYPNGRDISGGRTIQETYIRDEIMSSDGVATYVTVTVTNGAGTTSTRTSSPLVRDTTLPVTGEVCCRQVVF